MAVVLYFQLVDTFKDCYGNLISNSDSNLINGARREIGRIHKEYLAPNAKFWINLPSFISISIGGKINKLEELSGSELLVIFDSGRMIIYNLMEADSFARFKCTKMYRETVKTIRKEVLKNEALKTANFIGIT